MRVVRAADLIASPWHNGKGTTREIATDKPGDFGWRVSIADITSPAPFSCFPNYARTLVLAHGGPLTLAAPTWKNELGSGHKVSFPGEDAVKADLVAAATVVNVMTRNGLFLHRVRQIEPALGRTEHSLEADAWTLIVALSDGTCVNDTPLARHDTACFSSTGSATSVTLAGSSTVLAIHIASAEWSGSACEAND